MAQQGETTSTPFQPGVLLLGADGMLGTAWRRWLEAAGVPVLAPTLDQVDLADPAVGAALPADGWGVCVNCAAWTDVDGAEAHEAKATVINGDGAGRLAAACAERGALLVHYSTDYVFNGAASEPYPVDGPRDPVNAYGRSKAAGERAIERVDGDHIIVRTSWLYAPWGLNFVRTMARLFGERDTLRVVNDQRGRPTNAEGLVRTTAGLVSAGVRGLAHGSDGGECTWFEFAEAIERLTRTGRNACTIEPCGSDEFPRPAVRPAYSVLDLRETESAGVRIEAWEDALRSVLERMRTEEASA